MDYHDCGLDGLTFTRPSLVKPQFAADCDISNIVRKFIRTGELPSFRERPNIGSDANYPQSYQALQDTIAFAKSRFESLPLEEREKYNNSPEIWLDFQLQKGVDDESSNNKSQEESVTDASTDAPSEGPVSTYEPSSSEA